MNKAKRKGTAAETAVVQALREAGFPYVERRALAGSLDKGDILGIPRWVFEVKAHDTYAGKLAEWLGEVAREVENAGAEHGVVWHKRRGKGSAGDWFVTMSGEQFIRLLQELEDVRPPTLWQQGLGN